jgi:RNA polymerase sigma-70 factor, ECF subfamily
LSAAAVPGVTDLLQSGISSVRDDITAFVEREAPALLDYFGRRVSDPEDAADLLGETLVVVWRRKNAVPRDSVHARMWLYGVARKVLATQRRSVARRLALSDRLREEIAIVAQMPSPTMTHIRNVVHTLEEIDQEIIGLVYWEGFRLEEVAKILSIRPGTVRSRHARARARLRASLDLGESDE